ncbi:MAG TPA: Ig-like domain-containing protein [Gemmatimonadaceae bacterium]
MTQLRSILAVGVTALLIACGGDTPTTPPVDTTKAPPPPPPPPVVASVTLTGPAKLTVGRADTVKATARTAAGVTVTGKTFAFTSSNTAAVTVDAAGVVRAAGPGTATISGTTDGVTGTLSVVSTDASLFSMTLTPPANPILIGGTGQIVASGKDSSGASVAIRTITWTSKSPGVATVSSTGVVTGVSAGTATISAEGITNTAIIATTTITVVPVPIAAVVITPPQDTILHFRFPKQIVATARDSAGNVLQRPITYKSSNVDVAVLDDFGLATATGQGPVTVTATSGAKSASVNLYVVSDSGLYVASTGGIPGDFSTASIEIPNATSPATFTKLIATDTVTRFNFVTSTGSYRVRTSTSGDPNRVGTTLAGIALQLGAQTTPTPVTLGPPSSVVSIGMKPYTATITAPATAGVNSQITVTWTFDETTQPFSFYPARAPAGRVYYSSSNGVDLSGTTAAATVTLDPNTGIALFTATFTAPSTPGTLYIQVVGDGAVAQLVYPIKFLGVPYRTITIQ